MRFPLAVGKLGPEGRVCEDDVANGRFSLFCALYSASIEIAGVHRPSRPAMQEAADVLRRCTLQVVAATRAFRSQGA